MRTQPTRPDRRSECIAYHEAGHIVLALELQVSIGARRFTEQDGSISRLQVQVPTPPLNPAGLTGQERTDLERRIVVAFAGPEAEHRIRLTRDPTDQARDLAVIRTLADQVHPPGPTQRRYLAWLKSVARDLVQEAGNTYRIAVVGSLLLSGRALTLSDVTKALHAADREAARYPVGPSAAIRHAAARSNARPHREGHRTPARPTFRPHPPITLIER